MKNLALTVLALLATVIVSAQDKVTYSGYVPLNTKHYEYNKDYAKNEGGRYGLILSRKVDKETYFTETSFGALENSFGKFSVVAIQSIGKDILGVSVSVGIGITSGYKILYENGDKVNKFPKFLKETGLLPYVGMQLTLAKPIKITKDISASPLVTINPAFVNSGIKITLR